MLPTEADFDTPLALAAKYSARSPALACVAMAPGAVDAVARAFAREHRATTRFLDFLEKFMPLAPATRPQESLRLDWSPGAMRKCMKQVYDHRSRVLHEGLPFPPPMCGCPFISTDGEIPFEKVPGLASATLGGVWSHDDIRLRCTSSNTSRGEHCFVGGNLSPGTRHEGRDPRRGIDHRNLGQGPRGQRLRWPPRRA